MEAHQHSFLVCHSQTCNFTVGTILIAPIYRERKERNTIGIEMYKTFKSLDNICKYFLLNQNYYVCHN